MSKLAFALLAAAASGCGLPSNIESTEHTGMSRQPMVGGTVSTSAQDSTVFVMKGQDESCSGTLIAPNLVLTARHCVAEPNQSNDECVGYGATVSPSTMTIKVGVTAGWTSGSVAGTGKQIITPTTGNMCSFDVALIVLARDVAGAMVSPVRFTALDPNEATVAVGYGVDGNDRTLTRRMQRTTTVLGVGPASIAYKMKNGQTFDYTAPEGDVVTGESTCYGDSGGPLFDSKGNVVAMTSRGPANAPEDASHGNGCIDMVSIYSGARFNEATIRQAAIAAGHPLPANVEPTPPPAADDSTSTDAPDDETSSTPRGTTTSSSSNDETDPTPTKKKTTHASAVAPSGCSAVPGRTSGVDAWLLGAGVAIVIAAKRRRASTEPRRRSFLLPGAPRRRRLGRRDVVRLHFLPGALHEIGGARRVDPLRLVRALAGGLVDGGADARLGDRAIRVLRARSRELEALAAGAVPPLGAIRSVRDRLRLHLFDDRLLGRAALASDRTLADARAYGRRGTCLRRADRARTRLRDGGLGRGLLLLDARLRCATAE